MFWKKKPSVVETEALKLIDKLNNIDKLLTLHDRQLNALVKSVEEIKNLKWEYDDEKLEQVRKAQNLFQKKSADIDRFYKILEGMARRHFGIHGVPHQRFFADDEE